jgi:hypothetical protein
MVNENRTFVGKIEYSWKRTAMAFRISASFKVLMFCPFIKISPSVTSYNRVMRLSIVLFPEPFSPTMTWSGTHGLGGPHDSCHI